MHRFKSILSFLFIALNTLLLAKTIEFDLSVNEYSLASPRHTVWTHLSYLQNNEYRNESIAAKTLSFCRK